MRNYFRHQYLRDLFFLFLKECAKQRKHFFPLQRRRHKKEHRLSRQPPMVKKSRHRREPREQIQDHNPIFDRAGRIRRGKLPGRTVGAPTPGRQHALAVGGPAPTRFLEDRPLTTLSGPRAEWYSFFKFTRCTHFSPRRFFDKISFGSEPHSDR